MTLSLMRTARFALLLVLGFVLGIAALSVATATGAKNSIWSKLGVSTASANSPVVADNMCAVPTDSSSDVYFVSCGGFF